MMERGWFALDRGWFDRESFKPQPFTEREAFAWLIAEAAFEPRTIRARNGLGYSPVHLARGELCHAYDYMAEKWGWTYKAVRTFLKSRKKWGQIGHASGKARGTDCVIISITNYDAYQAAVQELGMARGAAPGTPRAHLGQQDKQLNNSKKNTRSAERGEPEGFAEWYAVYPRKKKPRDAAKAFASFLRRRDASLADLMARTQAHAKQWATQPKADLRFCPYPASWLNAGAYLEEPEAATAAGGGQKITAPTQKPEAFTETDWQKRLAAFKSGTAWPEQFWGPPPGSPGSLVPSHLIAAGVGDSGRGAGA